MNGPYFRTIVVDRTISVYNKSESAAPKLALGTPEAKQATANHSWHELCSSRLTLSAPLALAAATEMAL